MSLSGPSLARSGPRRCSARSPAGPVERRESPGRFAANPTPLRARSARPTRTSWSRTATVGSRRASPITRACEGSSSRSRSTMPRSTGCWSELHQGHALVVYAKRQRADALGAFGRRRCGRGRPEHRPRRTRLGCFVHIASAISRLWPTSAAGTRRPKAPRSGDGRRIAAIEVSGLLTAGGLVVAGEYCAARSRWKRRSVPWARRSLHTSQFSSSPAVRVRQLAW